jgi:DNA adenine methylase Dam
MIRSPFFYVGDKYKIFPQIKKHFPTEINNYYEPFLGGGSSFINVNAKNYILNDLDKYIISLHKLLINSSDKQDMFFCKIKEIEDKYNLSASYRQDIVPKNLKKEYKKTYYSKFNKNSYISLRDDFNHNQKQLYKLYLLLIYGFNRMLRFNKEGMFNLPVGNVDFNKNVVKALENYFGFVNNAKIRLNNDDYYRFLLKQEFDENDFIYLDPPYLISNSEYNKYWTEVQEKQLLFLLDKLNEQGVKWAISNMTHHKGKENNIFIEWANKYNMVSIESNYISYHDNSIKDKSREVLVKNYG